MNKESLKLYQNDYGNIFLIDCSTDLSQYDEVFLKVKKPLGSKCLVCNGTGFVDLESDESDLLNDQISCDNCDGSGVLEYEYWIAEFEDNKVKYVIKENDLDQYGTYYMQVLLKKESSDELPIKIHSETFSFEVYKQFK